MGKEILETVAGRKQIVDEIIGPENIARKSKSLREYDIYRSILYKYVYNYLSQQFSQNTLSEIPITSTINLARRVVDSEASIYSREPEREFTAVDEKQDEALGNIYADGQFDQKLSVSNACYKLQAQNILMCVPKDGKIELRVLKKHQVDVIPSSTNPEVAEAFIVSSFEKDKSYYTPTPEYSLNSPFGNSQQGDGINQAIADSDDYRRKLRFLCWTSEMQYIMDGNGNIVSEVGPNPINELPFIDVCGDKDFEFWTNENSGVADFTVEYNASLSMLNQIVKLQGFSQGVLKGNADVIPTSITVGPNHILKLINSKDADGKAVETSFEFVSPNPDLTGSREHLEMLLANFLTARGIDPSLVTGSANAQKFNSGIERLLSMVEQFEASREDYSLYRNVEDKLYQLVKKWHNASLTQDILLPQYRSTMISENSNVSVQFAAPEMIKTEKEQLELLQMKEELGVASKIDTIMALYKITKDEAVEKLQEIHNEMMIDIPSLPKHKDKAGVNEAETESIPNSES